MSNGSSSFAGVTSTCALDYSERLAICYCSRRCHGCQHSTHLSRCLFCAPRTKLPIDASVLRSFPDSPWREHFEPGTGLLARSISSTVDGGLLLGFGPRAGTAHAVNVSFLAALWQLDDLSHQAFGFAAKRCMPDSKAMMSLTSHAGLTTRPDGLLRIGDGGRIMTMWAETDRSMYHAKDNLEARARVWCPLCYAGLLAGGACAS